MFLENTADNEIFKEVVRFLLDPFVVTGLSSKKINKQIKKDSDCLSFADAPELSILEMLYYLKKNNTGRDADILFCQKYLSKFSSGNQEFLKSLFTKSLKLGVDAKSVNKVWGEEFIPTFDCMLANKYFDRMGKVEGKEFTITLKLDGIRCLMVVEYGQASLFSRQGQKITGLVDIVNEISSRGARSYVLDGELLISDVEGIPSKEQYKATTKIVRKDGVKHGITFRAFDFIPLEDFHKKHCDTKYSERRKQLVKFDCMKYVKVLPALYSGSDTSMIAKMLDEVRGIDQEGIMINLNDAPYEFKRTSNLLKCKVMSDCDLKIVGFEEGSGRLKGTLGRINVDYKGNQLGVGGGFSDADRAYFWNNQEAFLGRVITVQYFEETQDKDGKLSLRFPVFKELREIGKTVSYT